MIVRIILIVATVQLAGLIVPSWADLSSEANALYQSALQRRRTGDYQTAVDLLEQAVAANPTEPDYQAALGETLGWAKRFDEAEAVYDRALARFGPLRPLLLGRARIQLWRGRYREATETFRNLLRENDRDSESLEGLAQAAYWGGDFRRAEELFRQLLALQPEHSEARKSLSEIQRASAPRFRSSAEHLTDDQPFRRTRVEAMITLFSDPLTRWEITAGSTLLDDPGSGVDRTLPLLAASVTSRFPRLPITAQTGVRAVEFPDGARKLLGNLDISWPVGPGNLSVFWRQSELLFNRSALDDHPYVSAVGTKWEQSNGWSAVSIQSQNYFDGNQGINANAYYLRPLVRGKNAQILLGPALSYRDTDENRFRLQAVEVVENPPANFRYRFLGLYEPYWTPHDLREARLAVVTDVQTKEWKLTLQIDGGIARDRGLAFGPASGSSPLPEFTSSFFLEREFHPWQVRASFKLPLTDRLNLEASYRRLVTIDYRADEYSASVGSTY